MSNPDSEPIPPLDVDLDRPNVARIYDFVLGGKANWAVDRIFGQELVREMPLVRKMALANRQFLNRAVAYLCRRGIRQFLDIGAGVPTVGNTHQVADQLAPDSRVVYVDNEAVAVAHAEQLLDREGDPGRHAVIDADLRNPDDLWAKAIDTGVLNPDEPAALLMIAVLHIAQPGLDGTDISYRSVARYRELLSPGSYLAISHATREGVAPDLVPSLDKIVTMYERSTSRVALRSHIDIQNFMGDFALVDPGMVWTPEWNPEEQTSVFTQDVTFASPNESIVWAGVGKKSG